jgi:3-hydroxyisobutyrate dehydrogenase-like beta-hydroxyacid dehydrogenase
MSAATPTVGWIGTGRMGYQLARRLLQAGYDVAAWNRTRAKDEPLAEQGATVVGAPADLAARDIVCIMVAADEDLETVIGGPRGLLSGKARPDNVIDSSPVSADGSARVPQVVEAAGSQFLWPPRSAATPRSSGRAS